LYSELFNFLTFKNLLVLVLVSSGAGSAPDPEPEWLDFDRKKKDLDPCWNSHSRSTTLGSSVPDPYPYVLGLLDPDP
jgi:hypothetical protein